MRIWVGLILKITERTKSYPIHLPQPHPYNAQLARCILQGLSLQESTEIIQLINHLPTLFNLSHFPKGCDPEKFQESRKLQSSREGQRPRCPCTRRI